MDWHPNSIRVENPFDLAVFFIYFIYQLIDPKC